MTPQQEASTNPYAACPYCYSAYAYQFIQIPCPISEDNTNVIDGGLQTVENTSGQNIESSSIKNISAAQGKILMVVPQKDYQEMEFNEPKAYFESNGFNVLTASKGTLSAMGSSGEKVSIDMDLTHINLSDFKAVVFVGGEGIDELKLYEDPDYLNLAKSIVQKDILVGAICLAPKILANAGLLKGVDATSSDSEYIKSKGANFLDQPVVRSDKIITGNGPYAAKEFAQKIVAAITETGQIGTEEKLPVTEEKGNLVLNFNEPSKTETNAQGTAIQGSGSASKWRCTVCGYVYDPAEHDGVTFEQLPSTWKCPVCGVGKDKFVKI